MPFSSSPTSTICAAKTWFRRWCQRSRQSRPLRGPKRASRVRAQVTGSKAAITMAWMAGNSVSKAGRMWREGLLICLSHFPQRRSWPVFAQLLEELHFFGGFGGAAGLAIDVGEPIVRGLGQARGRFQLEHAAEEFLRGAGLSGGRPRASEVEQSFRHVGAKGAGSLEFRDGARDVAAVEQHEPEFIGGRRGAGDQLRFLAKLAFGALVIAGAEVELAQSEVHSAQVGPGREGGAELLLGRIA